MNACRSKDVCTLFLIWFAGELILKRSIFVFRDQISVKKPAQLHTLLIKHEYVPENYVVLNECKKHRAPSGSCG